MKIKTISIKHYHGLIFLPAPTIEFFEFLERSPIYLASRQYKGLISQKRFLTEALIEVSKLWNKPALNQQS
jgi:hypothetical protein